MSGWLLFSPAQTVHAKPDFIDKLRLAYPEMVGTQINDCILCHEEGVPDGPINDFASDFFDNEYHLDVLETLDSDGDGYTNLDELTGGTFPGDPASFPIDFGPDAAKTLLHLYPPGSHVETPEETEPGLADVTFRVHGNPATGQRLFEIHCVECHGAHGHGGIGPAMDRASLPSPGADLILKAKIANGVPGTYMRAWGSMAGGELSVYEINDLVAYITELRSVAQ